MLLFDLHYWCKATFQLNSDLLSYTYILTKYWLLEISFIVWSLPVSSQTSKGVQYSFKDCILVRHVCKINSLVG